MENWITLTTACSKGSIWVNLDNVAGIHVVPKQHRYQHEGPCTRLHYVGDINSFFDVIESPEDVAKTGGIKIL